MRDEFNDISITNDAYATNAPQFASSVAEVAETVAETVGVTELTTVEEISEGTSRQKLIKTSAKIISRFLSTSGAVAVVAAVAVVVIAEASAEPVTSEPAPTVPAVVIADVGVTSFSEDKYLSLRLTMTDDGGELESYIMYLEDSDGDTCECVVEVDGSIWTATTELTEDTDWENGLTLVIYAESFDGWTGEIFREEIAIPEAPEVGVEYMAAYNNDSGELTVTYELYDHYSMLSDYSVKLVDGNGGEVTSNIDTETYTITAAITDTASQLYLVVSGTSTDGWTGEIFREEIAIPEAPEVGVEYTTAYNNDSGELTITYELYDHYSMLSDYSVQLVDGNGSEVTSVIDSETYTITAAITDTASQLYLVVSGTSTDGWTGEIFREEIAIPETPEVGVEYTTAYNNDSGELTVTYELYDHYSMLSDYSVQLIDGNGNEVTSVVDNETYTITAAVTDTTTQLYLVVSGTSTDGWTGELYREIIILPTASDVTVNSIWLESYYSTTDFTDAVYLGLTYEGNTENIASYSYWFEDEDGQTYEFTVTDDGEGGFEAEVALPTETPPAFDLFGRLYLVIEATTTDGWTGKIYREKHAINIDAEMTVPTILEFAVSATEDSIMYIDVSLIIYDPDGILSDINLTLTDAEGVEVTYTITDTVDASTDGSYTYSFRLESATFTPDEYSDVNALITAMYTEPNTDGTYTTYEGVLYDYAVYVTIY